MKLVCFVLVLAAAAPALAAPGPVRTVVAGDRTISYVVDQRPDGSYILSSAPREPSDFRLRVKNGRVMGHVDGAAVSFRAPVRKAVLASAN